MDNQLLEEGDIFVGRLKKVGASENSLSVTIPEQTCEFCDLEERDLIKFKIVKIKKKGKSKK